MNIEYEELEKLMHFFDESSAAELKLQTGDVKLVLKKASLIPQAFSGSWKTEETAGEGAYEQDANRSDAAGENVPEHAGRRESAPTGEPSAGENTGSPEELLSKARAENVKDKESLPLKTESMHGEMLLAGKDGAVQDTSLVVTAPLAGIFYRSPKPGEKPYAEAGTRVKKGQTIGLMEAMKIINEIPAPCDGIVREILAADGEFAQFETPLMRIGKENG